MFGLKMPKLNRDWLVLGGSAILALAAAIQLRQNWPGVVPTIPGLYYGSGGPATGIYTGKNTPVPEINQLYQQDIRPTTGPIGADIMAESQKLGLAGFSSGGIGRQNPTRDAWTDVYDVTKNSAEITGDDPTKRFTLA